MKGKEPLTAIACSVFRPELEALRASGALNMHVYYLNSNLHMRPERLYGFMNRLVGKCLHDGRRVVLIYGDCHGYMADLCTSESVARTRGINCCELILGREQYQRHRAARSFYLLPEWTLRWKEMLTQLVDLTPEMTIDVMRESHDRLVYLATGVLPVPEEHIEACARHFGLPCDIQEASTGHLMYAVEDAVKTLPGGTEDDMEGGGSLAAEDNHSAALTAMTLDIVRELLADPDDLDQVIGKILRHVRQLSGARMVMILEHSPGKVRDQPDFRVPGLSPKRDADRIKDLDLTPVFQNSAACKTLTLIRENEANEAWGQLLSGLRGEISAVIPVMSGDDRLGTILALGLVDDHHVESTLRIQDTLSGTFALILKNTFLIKNQRDMIERLTRTREDLARSEERFHLFFDTMTDGFSVHEMIMDEQGRPADYRFLMVNPAFEQITGLKADDIVGRTVREVLPQTEPFWIDTYGDVVRTGKAIRFERYAQVLERYFDVVAYRPRENQFATIITDITTRKDMETNSVRPRRWRPLPP